MKRPDRLGYRGRALLTLAVLDMVYALSMAQAALTAPSSSTIGYLVGREALWAYAGLWVVVSIVLAVHAFRRVDSIGWATAIGLKVFWGCLLGVGGLLGEVPRAYLSVVIWWSFGTLVWIISSWPEPIPPTEKSDPEKTDPRQV